MNWTGGSLQRTKNAKKGMLQKQKAYFARTRTQLQNDKSRPAVPFRPNYLGGNDEGGLTRQLPPFGLGSIRHAGHAVRRTNEEPRQAISLGKHVWTGRNTAKSQVSIRPASHAQYIAQEKHKEGRNTADEDIETRLLEANRKKLLRQQDWVGIAPSKPVTLHFLSKSEKDKIGKRRKVQGRRGVTARPRTNIDVQGYQPQSAGGAVPPGFLPGPTQEGVDNIKIRIGTDAMTTAYSDQVSDHVQSHSTSDCMLFDKEGWDAQPGHDVQLRRTTPSSRLSDSASHTDVRTRRGYLQHPEPCLSGCASDQADLECYQMQGPDTQLVQATGQLAKSSAPGYQITHRVQGFERPLRLIFGDSDSSASEFSRISAQRDVDESPNAQTAGYAGASQKGRMHLDDNDDECSIIEGRSAGHAIVDEKRWKELLAISDGHSRHSTSPLEAGNRVVPRPYPARQYGEAVAKWSQHATQGDRTHISSSSISASLPAFRRPGSVRRCVAKFERRSNQAGMASRHPDEDERLWQGYVFGSENSFMSENTRNHEQDGTHQTLEGFGNSPSRFLPWPVAVSSVSSTPFRLISGQTSCISDNVQDRATFAPPSGTRPISPALLALAAELSDGEAGSTKTEDRGMGEESVTQLSLQNNASFDTPENSSGFIDDTKTSRSGLDQPDRTRDVSSAWAEDGTQELGRSLFAHERLAAWDEGLDLINPSSLG